MAIGNAVEHHVILFIHMRDAVAARCRHEIPDENIHSTTIASGNSSRNANGMRMEGIPFQEHCSNKKREIVDLKGSE